MSAGAKTADRVLRLLLAIAHSEEPPRIIDLSQATGFDRAAVHRLIRPLLEHAFIVREPDEKRYALGPGLIGISVLATRRLGFHTAAHATMERIVAETTETASLHIRDDAYRICIDAVEGTNQVRRIVSVGERVELYRGPTGKVMLAFLPSDTIARVLDLAALDGIDPATIEAELALVVDRGYLASVGERTYGVAGISAPVFDRTGIVGVITTSGPADRFSEEVMEEVAPFIVGECARLSSSLGHVSQPTSRTEKAKLPSLL